MANHAITFCEGERRVFAHRALMPCSEWASKHLIVQDGLYKGSPLRLDVAPYLAGPMDAFSSPGVHEVVVCGSLQVGKTLLLYSALGWSIEYRPGVKMLAMPTKDSMERVRDKKLLPLLKGSPRLRRLIQKYRRTTVALKDGTSLELASAESPSQRASITVQDLFLDEEDLYKNSGSAAAVEDFRGRTRSYGEFAKIMRACQVKGGEDDSSIWQGITQDVDQLHCYEVKCPACQKYHLPDVEHIVVPDGETDPRLIRSRKLARYRCPECKYAWSDHTRDIAVRNGRWQPYVWTGKHFEPAPAIDDAVSVGYHMPAILSRFVSLSDLAARGMLAKLSDDPKVKQQYYNDDLGRPYSPVVMETDKEQLLKLRDMSLPPRTVPHGAVALTCGIDVQKRGFWYLVRAWMPTLASYVVDYGYVDTWEDVETLCFDTYYPVLGPEGVPGWSPDMGATPPEYLTGEVMPIWRAGMDSGGTETEGIYTRTEEVYMWIRENGRGIVHACKGASRAQSSPVRWVMRERMPHNGKPIPGGLRLNLIDTNAMKNTDIGRMLNEGSTQPLRFHAGADDMLVSHLTAERQVRKGSALVWEAVSKTNHLLDCLQLSAACADASWTPSLPVYVLRLRSQERAHYAPNQTPRPKAKPKRPKQEKESRW